MAVSGHLIPPQCRISYRRGELNAPKRPLNGSSARGQKGYRHIRNYYLSNSKTFQNGNGNGNLGKINSNDFQDGNLESMEMKG